MLCFGIQHAIFIGARIGVWIFLQIFCLGCVCLDDEAQELRPGDQQAREDPNFDPYADYIASFNFEKWTNRDRNLDNYSANDQNALDRDLAGLR